MGVLQNVTAPRAYDVSVAPGAAQASVMVAVVVSKGGNKEKMKWD